jgi:hypothetical protein
LRPNRSAGNEGVTVHNWSGSWLFTNDDKKERWRRMHREKGAKKHNKCDSPRVVNGKGLRLLLGDIFGNRHKNRGKKGTNSKETKGEKELGIGTAVWGISCLRLWDLDRRGPTVRAALFGTFWQPFGRKKLSRGSLRGVALIGGPVSCLEFGGWVSIERSSGGSTMAGDAGMRAVWWTEATGSYQMLPDATEI